MQEGAGKDARIIELPANLSDFRSIATSIKGEKPVAIVFNAAPSDAAKLLKSLRALSVDVPLYFDESISNSISDFREILGDVSFLKNAGFLKLSAHTDTSFVERFQKTFGNPPAAWTDYAYDLVALALFLKDKTADESRDWLKTHTYEGVSGRISFDTNGLRKAEFTIGKLTDFLKLEE